MNVKVGAALQGGAILEKARGSMTLRSPDCRLCTKCAQDHQLASTSPEDIPCQFHCQLCACHAGSPDSGPNGFEYLDRCIWNSKEGVHVLIGVTRTCAVTTIDAHADAGNDRNVAQTEAAGVLPY